MKQTKHSDLLVQYTCFNSNDINKFDQCLNNNCWPSRNSWFASYHPIDLLKSERSLNKFIRSILKSSNNTVYHQNNHQSTRQRKSRILCSEFETKSIEFFLGITVIESIWNMSDHQMSSMDVDAPSGSNKGLLSKMFASCAPDPRGSVHRAWGVSLLFVVLYFSLSIFESKSCCCYSDQNGTFPLHFMSLEKGIWVR